MRGACYQSIAALKEGSQADVKSLEHGEFCNHPRQIELERPATIRVERILKGVKGAKNEESYKRGLVPGSKAAQWLVHSQRH